MFNVDKTFLLLLKALLAVALVAGGVTAAVASRDDSPKTAVAAPLQGSGTSKPGSDKPRETNQSDNPGKSIREVVLPGKSKPGPDKPNDGKSNSGKGPDESKKDFRITGSAPDLFPGAEMLLPLAVENPNNFAINVTSLDVTLITTSVNGCAASSLSVERFAGSLAVPKNGTSAVEIPIRMHANAADACQGAEFTLTYAGTGEKS